MSMLRAERKVITAARRLTDEYGERSIYPNRIFVPRRRFYALVLALEELARERQKATDRTTERRIRRPATVEDLKKDLADRTLANHDE